MGRFDEIHAGTGALHYDGPDAHGAQIIIDAAELWPGKFEIMALRSGTGAEIETRRAGSLEEARAVYADMVKRHTTRPAPAVPAPLSGKYAQLRDDLRAALEAAGAAAAAVDDGGTCNLDAAALRLPRWTESLVKRAAEEAGAGCWKWTSYGGPRFVFSPRVPGQARKREVAAEAMTAALRSRGYDAFNYCQMD